MAAKSSLLLSLCWVLGCAGGDEPLPKTRDNLAPTAALRTPVIAPLGRPVSLDASRSRDRDGDPLSYSFEINGGDAVQSAEPVVDHTFLSEGLYTVLVRVVDVLGAEAIATQDVTVRSEFPTVPDFCVTSSDCTVGDECDGGMCYTNGGALE